ncbi:efflux RND transporter periplasmic adaptor subunit [Sphingomonas morindae]|uniref:Efflux RND transporter periplasmic adaptor subunit n=1 Tax=Sphingomonas morindae TaxID=1541170 RepID=A0ABY4X3H4_9SPHN|nr:efflux RND transporter periplasmic adaptor subunit [Sphingomonas morindae]USI71418.1 efflux RND transporter periplasmic adaptor subunit [Sphingomonas morindae]
MNAEQGMLAGDAAAEDIPESVKRARRRTVLIVAAVLIVLVAALSFAFRKKPDKPVVAAAPPVTVIVPGRTLVANMITATGTLAAKRDMPVGVAGEGGMVSRVLVDAGDWVRAGQVLAVVDPAVQAAQASQMRAQILSAEAQAKLAQAQLERAQALVARGFISKADIDQRIATRDAARATVQVAEAQYREMTARLGRLDIRAPTNGLVLARSVEPGQVVSSGSSALFRVAMDGVFELRARLAEQQLSHIHLGMPVTVTPIGTTATFTGHVWQLAPTIDPTTRQGEARVQLAYAPALRPGGFATASFAADRRQAPLLPESAVLTDPRGGNYVFVVNSDNQVERREVKVGDVSDAGIAVLDGLTGDERVVFSAGAFLNPGDKITPELKKDR